MNTVLIIEPDTIFKENLMEILELEGFKPTGATTALEAESALNKYNPSFIICDESSLDNEFIKLRDDLKKAHKYSFILIINADGTNSNYKGADAYLKMPFRDDELLSKLNSLTRKKKA
jgi:DNA-binding response OmpR family regulator